MSTVDIAVLFVKETAAKLYSTGLEIAAAVGLPTTSWRTGDPEPAQFKYLATALETRDATAAEFTMAGFLSSAVQAAKTSGDLSWLVILASEVFGVTVPGATYATPTITLTNTGGGFFPIDPHSLTVKSSESGKTYHNTNSPTGGGTEGVLAAGETFTFALEADEAGSGSSAGVNEVDEIVTTMLGVVVVSSTAAVASDEPTPDEIDTLCRATLGALSPNGPADAYEHVALTSTLTGVTEINRAHTIDDSASGDVTLVVASESGVVSGPSITAVQDAIEIWATPNCVTPTTVSATPVTQDVTYTCSGENIPAGFNATVGGLLGILFAAIPIGGVVARSAIIATIHVALTSLGATSLIVTLTTPALEGTLAEIEVAVLGTVTGTEV